MHGSYGTLMEIYNEESYHVVTQKVTERDTQQHSKQPVRKFAQFAHGDNEPRRYALWPIVCR